MEERRKIPAWVHNLRADPQIELRDEAIVRAMCVREVKDEKERGHLWMLAVAAYPPYAEYQARAKRQIPVFVAEPPSSSPGEHSLAVPQYP